MAHTDRDWNQRYRDGQTAWDSGLPSRELRRVLDEQQPDVRSVLELGCGTGTNAVWLAGRGWRVTAVDCAPLALEAACRKAAQAGVEIDFQEADVQHFQSPHAPFDLVFDRGCYHCCRRVDPEGYFSTLQHATRPGSWMLCLAGNADEQTDHGPPRLTAQELCRDFEPLFVVLQLSSFRFQDAGEVDGPLGWSLWLQRR